MVIFQEGVGYSQGYRGSGSSQKLCVSSVSVAICYHCAKFTLRDPGGAGGSALNLSSPGCSCTVAACGMSAPSQSGSILLLPLHPPLGVSARSAARRSGCASAAPASPSRCRTAHGGRLGGPCHGHDRPEVELPIEVQRQLASQLWGQRPTSLPCWETGGGVVVGLFLIPVLA